MDFSRQLKLSDPAIAETMAAAAPMPLDAGTRNAKLAAPIENLTWDRSISDADAARACVAGLWLLANDLDRAHRICQELETAEGRYWHGVVHRREGDYGNARYWFRRAGARPAFPGDWSPLSFVDRVEAFVLRGHGDEAELIALQRREWVTLFDHCRRRALGD